MYCTSQSHRLYICELIDKYGSYGKIGLTLEEYWHVKLLLVSCRVISRGIGTVFLNFLTMRRCVLKFADGSVVTSTLPQVPWAAKA